MWKGLLVFFHVSLPSFPKGTYGLLYWGKGNDQTFQSLLDCGPQLTLILGAPKSIVALQLRQELILRG